MSPHFPGEQTEMVPGLSDSKAQVGPSAAFGIWLVHLQGFPVAQLVKNLPAMQETPG